MWWMEAFRFLGCVLPPWIISPATGNPPALFTSLMSGGHVSKVRDGDHAVLWDNFVPVSGTKYS